MRLRRWHDLFGIIGDNSGDEVARLNDVLSAFASVETQVGFAVTFILTMA
jgi:hypothetical protein